MQEAVLMPEKSHESQIVYLSEREENRKLWKLVITLLEDSKQEKFHKGYRMAWKRSIDNNKMATLLLLLLFLYQLVLKNISYDNNENESGGTISWLIYICLKVTVLSKSRYFGVLFQIDAFILCTLCEKKENKKTNLEFIIRYSSNICQVLCFA